MRLAFAIILLTAALAAAAGGPEPIRSVRIGKNRAFLVNGKPFFPLMSWLQAPRRYPLLRKVGINTFCGAHKMAAHVALEQAKAAGGYGVYGFDPEAVGHPRLLGWLHGDEPDLTRKVSDAEVVPAKNLRINSKTPLSRIVDGVPHSWSVLDPLEGAEITIELDEPVTAMRLAVSLTVSEGLAVAREVAFLAGGKELARATLKREKGRQSVELDRPATFSKLTFRVLSTYEGKHVWGSIGEIEAFDAKGESLLVSPPRTVPRTSPAELADHYAKIRKADTSRPVFLTVTASFMSKGSRYDDATRKRLYPAFVRSADVVGFDLYPIYGWNKPQWLPRVAEGTSELRELAGPDRPVYQWIETCKGSRWVRYDRQIDVLPRHTRAEVWMAVIRGATAIGYFTHAWKPSFTEFNCTEAMQRELARLNGQITRLAPAILADPATKRVRIEAGEAPLHHKATLHDGELWIFAQNMAREGTGAEATIHVSGFDGGMVEAIDEDRSLPAANGRFTDTFAPLAEHIYRIRGVE